MSDDYDDDFNDKSAMASDAYVEDYYDDGESTASKGSLIKALGIGVGATLVLELLIGTLLDTQTNLIHRYVSYMLGIAILFAASVAAKSTLKMFFVGTPVIVGSSFILPYFLPDYFSPLMGAFMTIIPSIQAVVDSLGNTGQDVSDVENSVNQLILYGPLIDLILAMFVGTLATIGMTGFVKIFSNKPNILTIFTFFYATLFFVIGVIILPYFLIASSGFAQFGMVMSSGAINLSAGFDIVDDDIDQANIYFEEAEKFFAEGDVILQGLEDLQVFTLIGTAGPDYKVIVDNLLILINSGVGLAQAVVPLYVGVNGLQSGMSKSLGVLDQANTLGLSQFDTATFEEGIDEMQAAFLEIRRSFSPIEDVLEEIAKFDEEALDQAVANQGVEGGIPEETGLIDGGIELIEATLDVFDVLITPIDDDDGIVTTNETNIEIEVEEPLVHLIRGVFQLSRASAIIGDTSTFDGTRRIFSRVVTHLGLVVDTFDEPAFSDFAGLTDEQLGNEATLIDVKDQTTGMFNFIQDAGNIGIGIGNFGIVAAPALRGMNQTLEPLGDGFDSISQSQYDAMIYNFTKPKSELGIIELAKEMRASGQDTDAAIAVMAANADAGEYGLMEAPANDMAVTFEEFGLAENGENFLLISRGFRDVLETAKLMQQIKYQVGLIQGNFTEINMLFQEDPITNSGTIQADLDNMNDSLLLTEEYLAQARIEVQNASLSLTSTTNMPDMQQVGINLGNIDDNLAEIQTQIGIINDNVDDMLTDAEGNNFSSFQTYINNITAALDTIDIELADIGAELGGVGINGSSDGE